MSQTEPGVMKSALGLKDIQLPRLAISVAGVLAVGLGGGWWPTLQLCGPAGVRAMLAAGCIDLVGLLIGLPILVRQAQANRTRLAMSFLATGPLRMLVALGGGLLAWRLLDFPAAAVMVWVALFYLLLLAAEAGWLLAILRTGSEKS